MVTIELDRTINKLVILTDDPTLHYFLESKQSEYKYIPWKKQWGYVEKTAKIYEPGKHTLGGGTFKYVVGKGWTGYLLGIFKEKLSAENYTRLVLDVLKADSYRTEEFPELRDYQNQDVLYLLQHRFGLMCVNTGYGKTQTIATLTHYAHDVLGKKVLLVCPSNKARDELVKRCKNVFGMEVSAKDKDLNGHLDCIITSGLMNTNKMKDDTLCSSFKEVLKEYDWVLADEVEYTINAAGNFLYDNCLGAERFYAFSGTADKEEAKMISFTNGLDESVIRNKDLIKYFGPSMIYRMPLNIDIDDIIVKTKALDNLIMPEINPEGNIYQEVMNAIWTDNEVCKVITRVIDKYPMLFIPINSLNSIIDHWLQNYLIGKYRVLLISSRGYQYYRLDGVIESLTLDQVCEYAKAGMIDVIPGTASSYRALDIPKLENIFLIQGVKAGVVLQQIGRVARGKHMNIISLEPYGRRKIPVYSKGVINRKEMFGDYYKFCHLTEFVMEETEL
jgi:hypothetical protein